MGSIFQRNAIDSQWILFRIHDRRFAIEAKIVKEILSIVPFNPSFLGGPGFFATFPLRGNLVYAFDLRYYWGEQAAPYSAQDNLLLLQNHIAIPIQEVLEISELDSLSNANDPSSNYHLVRMEMVYNEHVITLLDTESLLKISIETQTESSASNTKEKLHWFEVTTSLYTDIDKETLLRRKNAYERIETESESSSFVSLVVLESVNEKFCLPVEQILEFAEPGQITPIPGAKPELHGCMNLRGEVIPVLSLAALMGKPRKYSFAEGKVILVKDETFPIGILVDELLDIVNRRTSEKIMNSHNSKFNLETLSGSFIEASFPEQEGGHLNQLSLESIFTKAKSAL
ncbi:hypothetical protein LPTSP4_00090 [Leptospira ryugenii]|uniref:CheW-like domain-containing protein n=1 Tax=Leptospira ryugenii TaxID=1917863 RepID=A0A2P2DV92_9LEPT|nr:chemotaxis protein CheW [Leptospira ryugenii]GBF48510.1 hypothetical protein LPTSP4_00090 [Leptospira ryugenii]